MKQEIWKWMIETQAWEWRKRILKLKWRKISTIIYKRYQGKYRNGNSGMRKCKTLLRKKNAYNSEQNFENHHIRFKESISPLMDITVEVTIRIWPKRNKTMGYLILFDISTSRQDGKMIICVHKKSFRSTRVCGWKVLGDKEESQSDTWCMTCTNTRTSFFSMSLYRLTTSNIYTFCFTSNSYVSCRRSTTCQSSLSGALSGRCFALSWMYIQNVILAQIARW